MSSVLEIMNAALDLLDEEPIEAVTDDRTAVRWMNRNYQRQVDSLLRMHPWNFAKRRAILLPSPNLPVWGYSLAYPKPGDAIRILPLAGLASPARFSVEGASVLTNGSGALPIQYIARVESESFDTLFDDLAAMTLATRAANYITGKQSYAERCGAMAKDIQLQAQMVNGLEAEPETPFNDEWVYARQADGCGYGGGYGGYGSYCGDWSNVPVWGSNIYLGSTNVPDIDADVVGLTYTITNADNGKRLRSFGDQVSDTQVVFTVSADLIKSFRCLVNWYDGGRPVFVEAAGCSVTDGLGSDYDRISIQRKSVALYCESNPDGMSADVTLDGFTTSAAGQIG